MSLSKMERLLTSIVFAESSEPATVNFFLKPVNHRSKSKSTLFFSKWSMCLDLSSIIHVWTWGGKLKTDPLVIVGESLVF